MGSAAGGSGQAPTPGTTGANDQASGSPQANNGTAPLSGTTGNGQAPTPNSGQTTPSADDWQRAQQELAEARAEAARHRTELKRRDDAALSDDQRRARELDELKQSAASSGDTIKRLQLENAALRLAPTLGVSDPAATMALVMAEHGSEVQYGSDGRPTNLDTLIKQTIKDHPILAAQPTPPKPTAQSAGGATNPGRSAGGTGLTAEVIAAMSPRERVARYDEIQAWQKATPDAAEQMAAIRARGGSK